MVPLSDLHYVPMSTDLTNLLPRSRQRALVRSYFFRLSTVFAGLLTLIVIIHGLLLLPSYIYLEQQVQAYERQLAAFQAASSELSSDATKVRFARLDTLATKLLADKGRATGSGAIRALVGVPRPGVTLHSFSFAATPSGKEQRVLVSGTALTRDALRTYVQSLDALPYITKAELPISAYAEESDIDFTVTLTGTFAP